MKVQHSTTIELGREGNARELKLALEQVPDGAHWNTEVTVIEADRPWESRRTEVSLHCVWETEKPS